MTTIEAQTATDAAIDAVDAGVLAASPRPAMVGELARAHAAERDALGRAAQMAARVAELEAENSRLRDAQITNGGDPRLSVFWGRAAEIADERDYCEQYDAIAEELGGPRRSRSYTVTIDAKVDVRLYVDVTATTEEEAADLAEEEIDRESIIASLQDRGYDSIDVYNRDAEEG